jgi:hypothetical protein
MPVNRRASVDLVPHNANTSSEPSDLRKDDFMIRLRGSWFMLDSELNAGKPYPVELLGLVLLARSRVGLTMRRDRASGPPVESSELELSHFSASGGVCDVGRIGRDLEPRSD